jgi:hypothetical protein
MLSRTATLGRLAERRLQHCLVMRDIMTVVVLVGTCGLASGCRDASDIVEDFMDDTGYDFEECGDSDAFGLCGEEDDATIACLRRAFDSCSPAVGRDFSSSCYNATTCSTWALVVPTADGACSVVEFERAHYPSHEFRAAATVLRQNQCANLSSSGCVGGESCQEVEQWDL